MTRMETTIFLSDKTMDPDINHPSHYNELNQLIEEDSYRLKQYISAATANNTRKTYQSAIRQFEKWGGLLPADTNMITRYMLYQAERLNPRSLSLHLTAIGQWHILQGMNNPIDNPIIKKTFQGIHRIHGHPTRPAKALEIGHIVCLLKEMRKQQDSLKTKRDIALLLTGFLGAFRRSELINLKVSDVHWEDEGIIIEIIDSKTDKHHEGMIKAIPFAKNELICAAKAIKIWLESSNIDSGFLFRGMNQWGQLSSPQLTASSVNLILKHWSKMCGLKEVNMISSHSLRRGLTTSASKEKIDFTLIKKQGGWKTDNMVRRYIESAGLFQENVCFSLMEKMNQLY